MVYLKINRENLLNDFVVNAEKMIAEGYDYFNASGFSQGFKEWQLNVLYMATKGLEVLKRQQDKGVKGTLIYEELIKHAEYCGGEVFEMSGADALNLCYRAGFYW